MLEPNVVQTLRDDARTLANEQILLSLVTLLCAEDKTLAEAMIGDLERLGSDSDILRTHARFESQFGLEASQAFRKRFTEKINALGFRIAVGMGDRDRWIDI